MTKRIELTVWVDSRFYILETLSAVAGVLLFSWAHWSLTTSLVIALSPFALIGFGVVLMDLIVRVARG